jgi:Tfp pilus assembly protein PilN
MSMTKDYINLLPKRKKQRLPRPGRWTALALLFILAWSVALGVQGREHYRFRSKMASLDKTKQARLQELNLLYKELGIIGSEEMSRETSAIITSLMSERVLWSRVFREFSRIVPQGLWFDSVEGTAAERAEIKIRGAAFSYLTISEFLRSMEATGFFRSPQLLYAQKAVQQGQDVIGFEMLCTVQKGGSGK